MDEFRVLTVDQLLPTLSILGQQPWPLPFADFPRLFEELGWEKQRRKGGVTNLPVSLRIVSVGDLGGELAEVSFRISDTLPGDDPTNRAIVARHFPAAVESVAECVGPKPSAASWATSTSGVRWDVEDGRQINLLGLDDTIVLQYWSRRMADIERFERRHDVSSDDHAW